jgi:hypothetical protein
MTVYYALLKKKYPLLSCGFKKFRAPSEYHDKQHAKSHSKKPLSEPEKKPCRIFKSVRIRLLSLVMRKMKG